MSETGAMNMMGSVASGQRGAAVVEFALVAMVFFALLLGIMEFGRAMYLWNTVQEVTRHAAREAAVTDFTNAAAMDAVRRKAIFRISAGHLIAGWEISDDAVVINYLNASLGTVDVGTSCPSKNISTCLTNPADAACVRFVQARICQPGTGLVDACVPVVYSPMIGMFSFLGVPIPPSAVVMPAESLGFRPSAPAC